MCHTTNLVRLLFMHGVTTLIFISMFLSSYGSNVRSYMKNMIPRFDNVLIWVASLMPPRWVLSHVMLHLFFSHAFFWWEMVSFVEKFEQYQQTSGRNWGRTKEMSVCFEREGFYHIWTKKGWYVWIIWLLELRLLSCVSMLLFNVWQKMLLHIRHVFCGLTWRSPSRTMLRYIKKLVGGLRYTWKNVVCFS